MRVDLKRIFNYFSRIQQKVYPVDTPGVHDYSTFNFGDLSISLLVILYEELLFKKAYGLDEYVNKK
jgi:hypothetical protein